jgi:hypothetical protein
MAQSARQHVADLIDVHILDLAAQIEALLAMLVTYGGVYCASEGLFRRRPRSRLRRKFRIISRTCFVVAIRSVTLSRAARKRPPR